MKRTDITNLFPDATDDQINTLMGINGNDINNAKQGTKELQTALTAAQTELETLKNSTAESDLQNALARISELQADIDKRNAADALRTMREKVAGDVGVPVSLLTAATEEECRVQAQGILDFAKPSYPNVRDGGEPHVDIKQTTRQQFAEWFNQVTP